MHAANTIKYIKVLPSSPLLYHNPITCMCDLSDGVGLKLFETHRKVELSAQAPVPAYPRRSRVKGSASHCNFHKRPPKRGTADNC